MVEDRIERDIVVAASPQRVWEIITKAEHVGTWFGDAAEIDLRPGGAIMFRWDSHGTTYGVIEKVEPPRVFSYRWASGAPGEQPADDNTTLVEFTLTPQGGHTHVRVVESGFSRVSGDAGKLAEQFQDHTQGWGIQLRDLQQYLEGLPV